MSILNIGNSSDANYWKIAMKGSGTLSLPASFGATDSDTITHNLGYYPNVRVWFEPNNDGDIWVPHKRSVWSNALLYFEVTTTGLTITAENGSVSAETVPYYYRIYYDGEQEQDNALTSDRENEKILIASNFATTVNASSSKTVTVPHSLGRAEFVKFIFQTNISYYTQEGGVDWDGSFADYVTAIAHMDASNIYFEIENSYSSAKDVDVYYVVIART